VSQKKVGQNITIYFDFFLVVWCDDSKGIRVVG